MKTSLAPIRRPAGYPADFEQWIDVTDGRTVFARPVIPDDATMLQRALENADPETIYQRFFRAPVRLDAAQLDRLCRLDYQTRFALAAFSTDGDGVAIVRYESTEPGVAEVAVVVQPGWRGLGLGTALLASLEEAAIERGIRRFTAYYLPDNAAIEALLSDRGFTTGIRDGEVSFAEKDLSPEGYVEI
jgi:GNAT superfamily N-acetyltransferase